MVVFTIGRGGGKGRDLRMDRHPYGRLWHPLWSSLGHDLVRGHQGSSTTGWLMQPGTRSLAKVSWLFVDGQLPLSLSSPRRGFN